MKLLKKIVARIFLSLALIASGCSPDPGVELRKRDIQLSVDFLSAGMQVAWLRERFDIGPEFRFVRTEFLKVIGTRNDQGNILVFTSLFTNDDKGTVTIDHIWYWDPQDSMPIKSTMYRWEGSKLISTKNIDYKSD